MLILRLGSLAVRMRMLKRFIASSVELSNVELAGCARWLADLELQLVEGDESNARSEN